MRAVVFDLYETLVTEYHPEWFDQPRLADQLGIDAEVFRREWRARYERRMTGQIVDHAAALRELCDAAGAHLPEPRLRRLVAERLEGKARPFTRAEAGVVTMLEVLRGRGITIGLVSNCTREEVAAWDASPFPGLVDVAVFSHDVGVIKPSPEIYAFACDRLRVPPAETCYVGDGGWDELGGADAAGLQPIWATWFIERWPWDWVGDVAETAVRFPRCRTVDELPDMTEA